MTSASSHCWRFWLAVLHYAAAVISVVYFILGWYRVDLGFVGEVLSGTDSVVIADSKGYTRVLQSPVLLTYSFGAVFAFAVVAGTGLLIRRLWARRWAMCTPVVTLPLLVPVVCLIARCIVLDRYGCTSTDPAFPGHVTPIADLWRAAVIVLVIWAAATAGYWLILRKSITTDGSVAAGRMRLGGRCAYPAAFIAVLGLLLALTNFRMSDGRMLIHDAASYGWSKVVAISLPLGQDVNARTDAGSTPLHYAAGAGRLDTVEYLLDHGADINARDGNGRTPVAAAAQGMYSLWDRPNRDCYSVLRYLVRRNADIRAAGYAVVDGVNTVTFCLQKYPGDLVQELVERGLPVNAGYPENKTLMAIAVEYGRPRDIDHLLSHGAQVYPELAMSAEPRNLAHLLNRGLDVNARDAEGRTALHYALEHDIVGSPGDGKAIVRLLVRHGANIRAKDNYGETPLGLADDDLRRILVGHY